MLYHTNTSQMKDGGTMLILQKTISEQGMVPETKKVISH